MRELRAEFASTAAIYVFTHGGRIRGVYRSGSWSCRPHLVILGSVNKPDTMTKNNGNIIGTIHEFSKHHSQRLLNI